MLRFFQIIGEWIIYFLVWIFIYTPIGTIF